LKLWRSNVTVLAVWWIILLYFWFIKLMVVLFCRQWTLL